MPSVSAFWDMLALLVRFNIYVSFSFIKRRYCKEENNETKSLILLSHRAKRVCLKDPSTLLRMTLACQITLGYRLGMTLMQNDYLCRGEQCSSVLICLYSFLWLNSITVRIKAIKCCRAARPLAAAEYFFRRAESARPTIFKIYNCLLKKFGYRLDILASPQGEGVCVLPMCLLCKNTRKYFEKIFPKSLKRYT